MILKLDETQTEIVNLAREFAEKHIRPIRADYDEKEEFPTHILEELKKIGFFSIFYPAQYGGIGGGITELALLVEELSKVDSAITLPVATSALGAIPIMLFADDSQRNRWLNNLSQGEKLAAFALSEPEAGSDAIAQKTTATKEGDYYILNGLKHFCSSGNISDYYVVFASTNPQRGARGISVFLVERGAPGFKFGKKEKKMGIRANPTTELIFENCKVPKENMIGAPGFGIFILQETFDYSRPGVAAQAIGIAEGALKETIQYLKERKQFGQTIISFQAINHKIAELSTKIEAAKAFLYSITMQMDAEFKPAFTNAIKNKTTLREEIKKISRNRWTKYSAMIKLLASDIAFETAQECVNLCGGIGYTRDFPIEKFMRDAKVTQIYEGTNNIQKNEIAAQIIKEN
jgi:alkylation response protein AidB-like acyl-CoA dehydrogenase